MKAKPKRQTWALVDAILLILEFAGGCWDVHGQGFIVFRFKRTFGDACATVVEIFTTLSNLNVIANDYNSSTFEMLAI